MLNNDRGRVFQRSSKIRNISRKIGRQRIIENLRRIAANMPPNSPNVINNSMFPIRSKHFAAILRFLGYDLYRLYISIICNI